MTRIEKSVEIRMLPDVRLEGSLTVPQGANAIVLFAHGSGSGRLSPRNQFVARALNRAGLGTLLFDLLTPAEDHTGPHSLRFNIDLLASRLVGATDWVVKAPETRGLRIGYFGASTGAAAALVAAAQRPTVVGAVVSRGGRPDLAQHSLGWVEAPTCLVVGSEDHEVLRLNEWALARLRNSDLVVVRGATHLFEEPGALKQVAGLAAAWFSRHLLVECVDRSRADRAQAAQGPALAPARALRAEETRHAQPAP